MMQSSKYIGQGYVIDYLLQFYLKDKFKSIQPVNNQDNASKLNFIVENENGVKLGVHVTINTDDSKTASFIKHKPDILLIADKAIYLHINLSLHENEKQDENQLITNILDNAYIVIKNSFSDIDDIVAYQVSPYGMQKQDLNKIITYIAEYRNNLIEQRNKNIDELEGDPIEASIIRIKGKLIVVELESGSTHVGVVDYDAVNKDAIIEKSNEEVKKVNKQFRRGLITDKERFDLVIDIWTKAKKEIEKEESGYDRGKQPEGGGRRIWRRYECDHDHYGRRGSFTRAYVERGGSLKDPGSDPEDEKRIRPYPARGREEGNAGDLQLDNGTEPVIRFAHIRHVPKSIVSLAEGMITEEEKHENKGKNNTDHHAGAYDGYSAADGVYASGLPEYRAPGNYI